MVRPMALSASLPKTSWLLDWEKQAIITYALAHPDQGYRRLAYQMIDEDVVAVSAQQRVSRAQRGRSAWSNFKKGLKEGDRI